MFLRQEDFAVEMARALPVLHRYFYNRLRRGGMRDEIGQQVNDLVQITSLRTYLNSQKATLMQYNLRVLFLLKAKNELANFYAASQKRSRTVTLEIGFETVSPDPDPYERLVQREQVAHLHASVDRQSLDILLQLVECSSYKDLAHRYQTTEGALKMRIYRIRKILLQYHGR